MRHRRAIDELLAHLQADPHDMRNRLRLGDLYAKDGDLPHALEMFEVVGKYYADQGFSLKALAIYKHILSLVDTRAPELREQYTHVAPILAELFERLGLNSDAATVTRDLAARRYDRLRWS